MRRSTIIGCLSLILCAAPGCGDKDKDKDKGKSGSSKGAAKTTAAKKASGGAISMASRTIEMPGFTVVVDAPTGWREQKFGGGLLLTKPGGVFNSTVTLNTTCEGSCGKIAENLTKMAANQVKMHSSFYPNAKVVHDGAVSAGGHEFQLDLARKDGSKAAQYKLVRFQEGWSKGINCTAMLLKGDAKEVDTFKAACNGMKITVKKAP